MTGAPFAGRVVPAGPIVLVGPRIELSPPTEDDVDRIAELCRDASIARWTTVPSPYVRQDAEDFVGGVVAEGWASGRSCTWAVRPTAGGALLGIVSVDGIHDAEGEVGFWLAPEVRGRGYLSEALALAIDYVFAPLPEGRGIERLVWHAFVGNTASASVARRAGFRFEGVRRLGGSQRGRRLDDWQAALLATDPRSPASDWPAATLVAHAAAPSAESRA